MPPKLGVQVNASAWPVPPIFELLRRIGSIPEDDWRRTFNLGIGMVLVISQKDCAKGERILRKMKEPYFEIGSVAGRRNSIAPLGAHYS